MNCAPGIKREKITSFLENHKVGTRLLFGGNLTKQPAYQSSNYRIHGELNDTDQIMQRTFWIAVHPGLSDARISYMVDQLEKAVQSL
jgi:CDP-6-deoxy-D-xylo-4-hexulose-3-dehydrase